MDWARTCPVYTLASPAVLGSYVILNHLDLENTLTSFTLRSPFTHWVEDPVEDDIVAGRAGC